MTELHWDVTSKKHCGYRNSSYTRAQSGVMLKLERPMIQPHKHLCSTISPLSSCSALSGRSLKLRVQLYPARGFPTRVQITLCRAIAFELNLE